MTAPALATRTITRTNLSCNPGMEYAVNQRVNLISNPSFEVDLTGWASGGNSASTLTQDATQHYLGTKCMKIVWSGGGIPSAQTTVSNLIIGQQYWLTAQVFVPTGSNPNVKLGVFGVANGGASWSVFNGSWQQANLLFTATQTSHIIMVLPDTTPGAGTICYVDAVDLEVSQTFFAPTYFDGSNPPAGQPAFWNGTANLSQSYTYAPDRTNLCTNPSFETNTTGWSGSAAGYTTCTIATSTTQKKYGAQSMLVTWPTAGARLSTAQYPISGLTVGHTYKVSIDVYVPTGNPVVRLVEIFSNFGDVTNTTNQFQRLTLSFVATATSHFFGVVPETAPTSGQICYVDGMLIEDSTVTNNWVYFDGSFAQSDDLYFAWDGTANASKSYQYYQLAYGWMPGGSPPPKQARSNVTFDTGSQCMKLTWQGNTFLPSVFMHSVNTTPGNTYVIRFRHKAPAVGGAMVAGVVAGQAFPLPPPNVANNVVADGNWKTWIAIFTATNTSHQVALWPIHAVGATGPNLGDVTYVDSFTVEDYSTYKQDQWANFFDGDNNGGIWSGTAGVSSSTRTVPIPPAYTSDDAVSRLLTSGCQVRFRYEWLDKNNNSKGFVDTYIQPGGQISYDYNTTIKRTGTFNILDGAPLDFTSDRIRPWQGVLMPDGSWFDFPLGIFILNSPTRHYDAGLITRQTQAYDQTQLLIDYVPTQVSIYGGFTIPAGTLYTDAIIDLLNRVGITDVNIITSDRVTPNDRTWKQPPPSSNLGFTEVHNELAWQMGANAAKIIADLLQAINYGSLWFDGYGTAQVLPYVSPERDSVDHVYATDSKSIIFPAVDQTLDLFSVPNVIVLVVSQPDRPLFSSQFVNSDPTSPISTVSRGRRIMKFDSSLDVATQSELDSLAKQEAIRAANIYESINWTSLPMPNHGERDLIMFTHTGLGIAAKYAEQKWTLTLSPGAGMTHEMRRVVNIDQSLLGDPDTKV